MSGKTETPTEPCRQVRPDEVEHFRAHGWVKLEKFIDPARVALLLALAREKMGEDGDSNARDGKLLRYFNPESALGLANPSIRPLIEAAGRNGKLLLARRSGTSGIMCRLEIPATENAVHVSITHLRFDPRAPLAREITAYQKHRVKHLKSNAS